MCTNTNTEKGKLSDLELRTDVQVLLDQLKIRTDIIPKKNKNEWHAFRLKAKAVRYKIEFYREAYGCKEYETELDNLIFLQQNLGKMRDHEKLKNKIAKQADSFESEEIQNTLQKIQKRFQEKWCEIADFFESQSVVYNIYLNLKLCVKNVTTHFTIQIFKLVIQLL